MLRAPPPPSHHPLLLEGGKAVQCSPRLQHAVPTPLHIFAKLLHSCFDAFLSCVLMCCVLLLVWELCLQGGRAAGAGCKEQGVGYNSATHSTSCKSDSLFICVIKIIIMRGRRRRRRQRLHVCLEWAWQAAPSAARERLSVVCVCVACGVGAVVRGARCGWRCEQFGGTCVRQQQLLLLLVLLLLLLVWLLLMGLLLLCFALFSHLTFYVVVL